MPDNKATMTDRERVEAMLRREKLDRVPIHLPGTGFSTVYAGGSIADAYNKPNVSLASQRKAWRDFGCVCTPLFGRPTHLASEFGGEIKLPSSEFSQAPMVTRFPVDTVEDVWNLKPPDVKTAGTVPMSVEFGQEFYKTSLREEPDNEPFIMFWAGGLFTGAANIPSLEKICRWLIRKPEVVHRVMRLTTDYYIELAQYWKDTFGVDRALPLIGEPSTANNIISPKQFEQFVLPYTKEYCDILLNMGYKHIFVHICGEQNLNLPYWAQIPFGDPGLISIGNEIKLETAAKYFPNDIIVGNLEPAIVQVKAPEEVYQAAGQVIKEGKKISGGYVFSLGCELPPNATVENVRALTRAVNDFGWYD